MSEPIRVEFAHDLNASSRQPVPVVEVANALDGRWTPVAYAERVRVRAACSPEYGEASFSRAYGEITRADRDYRDAYLPLDLAGKYVRITIPNEDAIGDPLDDPAVFVWYGIIEQNEKELIGDMTDNAAGYQTFTAYGLIRVLDRVLVDSAVVRDPDGTERRIPTSRPFNLHRLDGFVFGANRSIEATDGVYTFTPDPLFSGEWTAFEAVQYLLKHHGPLDGEGDPACNLALRGPFGEPDVDGGVLSWFKLMADTTGRSVKQLLDQLIPRTRGVGYWVGYEEPENIGADDETGRGTITVNLFTFVTADLILRTPTGDDVVLPENPHQIEWDFERDPSVSQANLVGLDTTRYDKIIVEGANITATATFALDLATDAPIVRDWTQQDENLFKTATSSMTDYAALPKGARYNRNAQYRGVWEPNVFRSWRVNPLWNQVVYDLVADVPEGYYHVTPSFVDDTQAVDPLGDPEWRIDRASYGQTEFSNRDVRFLPFLPLKFGDPLMVPVDLPPGSLPPPPPPPPDGDSLDSDPDRTIAGEPVAPDRPEMGLVPARIFGYMTSPTDDAAEPVWAPWDVFPDMGWRGPGISLVCPFRVVFDPRADWPGFYLRVEGGPRTLLGRREWTTPADPAPDYVPAADTAPMHDPRLWGIAWQDLYVTATLDLGVPLRAVATVNTVGRKVTGRTLRIYLPDARLDTIAPRTILAIFGGRAHQTAEGKVLQDHRQRLHRIATAAATWYGTVRQQLTLKRRRVSVHQRLRLGALIVRTGLYYGSEQVNTPITAIDIDCEEGSVRWETGFVDLDLAP